MKTAEEWFDELVKRNRTFQSKYPYLKAMFKSIQADAIRGAVETIRYSDIYDGDLNQLEPALKLAKSLEK